MADLLTDQEHRLVAKLGECMADFMLILGSHRVAGEDAREFCNHIHALQHTVMSQAAGRAYPGLYRTVGGRRSA